MTSQIKKLSELVGGGYNEFWNFKGRYRVVKGSRGSKKSKTTALWFMSQLSKEKYNNANLLVVRKTYRTLKDSCFKELKWAINRLDLNGVWRAKENPLEIENIFTGQKVYFRGLDDPLKVTSITVDVGVLCWLWIEEAYEINTEDDFNTLDESIRGVVPEGLFKQVTLTFNPWNEHHWLKKRFFDAKDDEILALTTTYMCNEWLDEADLKLFERMKKQNPSRYKVAGLGEWGVIDGLVYENVRQEYFDIGEIRTRKNVQSAFGLDFGYTCDPTAMFCGMVDIENKKIFVFDEIYEKGMSNERIYEAVLKKGYAKERITADSAEPKSIDRLYELGLKHISGARKGRDSINSGIDFIRDFEIIVHPNCENFFKEIQMYVWAKDPKTGQQINKPVDDFNHLMDAMRYALENLMEGERYSFK